MRDLAAGCLALDAIEGFVRGTVDAGATDRIEEHLDGCDDCRALVAALARGDASAVGRLTGGDAAAPAAPPGTGFAPTAFAMAAPGGAAALLGTTLADTYQLVRVIGKGGMGVIYEAQHVRLRSRRCAVKVLDPQMAANPEVLARFRREAEIVSRLGNPHIVEAHDFHDTAGQAFMVMELLEGEDLAARLRARGALPVDQVLSIIDQLASALDAAHSAGIVHRDLKPANVFLCRRGGRDDHVKVLDFGLSKVLDSITVVTRDYSILGTPAYMSPEQAEGRIAEVDARADVFALGAIAWEMLTGQKAFGAGSIAEGLHKVRFVDPPPVHHLCPEVSPVASAALAHALAKDRSMRTPSVAGLAAELGAALRAAPPVVAPPVLAPPVLAPPVAPPVLAPVSPPVAQRAATPPPSQVWPGSGPVPAYPGSGPVPLYAPPAAAHASSGPAPAYAGQARAQAASSSRGLVIALVLAGLVAVGVWIAVVRSLQAQTEPVAETPPAEAAPAEAAPAQPAPAEAAPVEAAPAEAAPAAPVPAPAAPAVSLVALSFTIEPARVDADVQVDGKPVDGRRMMIARSDRPVAVTAQARGYPRFHRQVVPDRDRTVAIVFRGKKRSPAAADVKRPRPAEPPAASAPPVETQPPPAPSPSAAQPPARAQPRPKTQPKPAPRQPPKPPPKPRRGTGTIFDQ